MPLVSRTFDQLIDFTRTSAATYVDETGKIVLTPASRNLLTFTQEFNNAAWSKQSTTVTADATTSPDGTVNADKLIPTAVSAAQRAVLMIATVTASTAYTVTCYVKAGEYSGFYIRDGFTGFNVVFNLATGTVSATASASGTISSVGNGWFRCSATMTSSGTNFRADIGVLQVGTQTVTTVYTGDGTSGIFIWGAQLEANTTATDYTRNVGGVYPPRFDYDPVTLAPKGLLIEEQRTNLLRYSEQFDNALWSKGGASVSVDGTTAPDGSTTAAFLKEDTSTGFHQTLQSYAFTASGPVTISFYAKAASRSKVRVWGNWDIAGVFDLVAGTVTGTGRTITPVGNGWFRCVYTGTVPDTASRTYGIRILNDAGAESYTGDGTSGVYIWGAQLEAGAFATSYIPTVASQVTRTADVATITGANFSQWYNQSEGTVVAEFSSFMPNTNSQAFWTISDGSNNERWTAAGSNNKIAHFMVDGGATQASIEVGTYSANAVLKSAMAIRSNSVQAAVNGTLGVEDTSATIPTVNRLGLGTAPSAATAFLNGHIRSIRYYPTRLTNAQLQALTA